MNYARPLLFAVTALTLLISACSQPADVRTPGLEPQFGTAGDDAATAVSIAPNGIVTTGVELNRRYDAGGGTERITLQIRQLDSNAALKRQIEVGNFSRLEGTDTSFPTFVDIKTDKQGNVYALTKGKPTYGSDIPFIVTDLYKYGSGSAPLWKKTSSEIYSTAGFDLDANGNVFVAQTNRNANGEPTLSYFTRYSPSGVKWYQRNSQVGVIRDIEVTANGDIYIVGSRGLSRYNSGGTLLWTKAIPGDGLASSSTSIFVLATSEANSAVTISKRTNSGAFVWATQVGSDPDSFAYGLVADSKGNTYYNASAPDIEPPSVNKLDVSGKKAWSTVLQFDYDRPGARALASYDGTSVYALGSTIKSVNGLDTGGSDGFIVRLNAQGQKVWER